VLLKFFELEARFPHAASEMISAAVVDYVAEQVKVHRDEFGRYDWVGGQSNGIGCRFGLRSGSGCSHVQMKTNSWLGWLRRCVRLSLRHQPNRLRLPTHHTPYLLGVMGPTVEKSTDMASPGESWGGRCFGDDAVRVGLGWPGGS
jgi:hypothetical protein